MAARLSLIEVQKRLSAFAASFKDASNEQGQAAIFWTRFYECYGIRAEEATIYEQAVRKLDGSRGRIDSFMPGVVLVEHKSKGKNLDAAYEQASDYFLALAEAERPKYIITSDFARIRLYDLAKKASHECSLEELPHKASWFAFLLGEKEIEITEETPINRDAAYQISKIHEALLRINFKGHDLEVFMTRLLFCMFADDTGIFGENNRLRRLVENTKEDGSDLGAQLTELFDVFDQPEQERQTTLHHTLAAFPYINGALFKARTRIPSFNSDLRQLLIDCSRLDWSGISPAIFGAMFQGVLEEHEPNSTRQASRRELGAHYTSERNILRVINPLFMDELRAELASAGRNKAKLEALYNKLPTLTFFDPACGCGNFLVIAYRELRRLEFAVISELHNFKHTKGLLDISTLCRVQLDQFYGLEIDEAAVHIARVALYITDHQLNCEAAQHFGTTRPTIPLSHTPNIVCDNAIRKDWNSILPAEKCSYIISNPPFVGAKYLSEQQKLDMELVAGKLKGFGLLDFVTAWYIKASQYAKGAKTSIAFVSTNSITQGEQVAILWGWLLGHGIRINFAHRTFKWSNEGKGVAAVHCVIVGFSYIDKQDKKIYCYPEPNSIGPVEIQAKSINPYLADAPLITLENRSRPISPVPVIGIGNKPIDGGNYLFTEEEKKDFLHKEPAAAPYFRKWLGADEFINGFNRWCLWLGDCSPSAIRSMPNALERVQAVKQLRLNSKSLPTQKLADTPTRFHVENFPESEYLIIPRVSSERRKYIPIGYVLPEVLTSDSVLIITNTSLYHFGVITALMHMAWTRTVCGRLKSDFRYSASIVYNNFVWPQEVTEAQRKAIEKTGQGILDARANYPDSSLADLYDPLTMPPELVKAHEANNKAVDKAYGYKGAGDDASRVAFLFELYEKANSLLPPTEKKRKAKATTKKVVENTEPTLSTT